MKDLHSLDIAVSSHILRPLLFEAYQFLNLECEKSRMEKNKLAWFTKRSLFLKRLCFESHLTSAEITEAFDSVRQCPSASKAITYIDVSPCIRNVHLSHIHQISLSCNQLSTLVLPGYKRNALFSLSHPLPLLATLDLSRCYMPDDLVQSIADHCPALVTLKLQGCIKLTNQGVLTLSRGCHSLTSLNLTRCEKLADVAVTALVQGCPNLTSLDLKKVHKLTDTGTRALAGCSNLTSLDLDGCSKITDATLGALSQGCRALTTLHVGKCRKITTHGLRAATASSSSLRIHAE